MALTLKMPVVGETVTEGTIERWPRRPGEHVDKYEAVVEVNTDKVNVELPSPVAGTVVEILAPEGAVVAVGASLAIIDEVAGEVGVEVVPPVPKEEAVAPAAEGVAAERRRATPRVRRLAQELGVDLERVTGSGPSGRILEEDVRAAAERKAPAPTAVPAVSQEEESISLTAIRRTIAQRMAASMFSAPHAWLAMDADVTGLVRLREAQKETFRQRHGFDLTYLPFVVHAVAQSLPQHPYLNASWAEDHIILKKRIHIGIAVATELGLLVPVIHDADRLSITGLARAVHDLSERARAGKLQLGDVQGGTFTVDNTGIFGSIVSMPIINQGQAAIISLETISKRPVVVADDAIAVRSMVALCLSFDHRILDGAQASAFVVDVKIHLEAINPVLSID